MNKSRKCGLTIGAVFVFNILSISLAYSASAAEISRQQEAARQQARQQQENMMRQQQQAQAERVNDIATPGGMNLVSKC